MSADERPSLDPIADHEKLSRFQIVVIALCAGVMILDGFDTQAIAFAAPGIAADWHISPTGFSFVFGIGLFGGLVGAICTGVIADRFGRKPTLVLAVILFGLASLSTPFADSKTSLSVIRFITGLGVGGALPGAIAIAAEYASKRMRATVAAVTFCGIPLGSVIASVLASRLIPDHGWGIIFVIGGVLPLVLAPFIILYVPESIRFLSLRHDDSVLAKTLAKMGFDDEETARVTARAKAQVSVRPESGAERTPIWNLFTEGRALGTTLLSLSLFLTLLMAFFLVNWIPTLATQAGIGTSAAILGVGSLNIGGILGSLVISRFSRRFRPGMMISVSYGLGAVAIAVVGQAGTSGTWLLASTFVAGFLAIGAQMCTVSLLATYYDTQLRATGVGWAMGCGRVGGIIGPTVGGWLVAASFSMGTIFVIAGLVCATCAVTVFGLGRFVLYTRADATAGVDAPAAKAARTA